MLLIANIVALLIPNLVSEWESVDIRPQTPFVFLAPVIRACQILNAKACDHVKCCHGFCHTAPVIDSSLFLCLVSFSTSAVSQISFTYHLTLAYAEKAQLLYSLVHLHFMFIGNNCILRTIHQGQDSCRMLKLQVEALLPLNPSLPLAILELRK